MSADLRPAFADLARHLAAIVGERHVVTDPAVLAPHLVEWRGLYRGTTPFMVRPGSTAEVAAVVRAVGEAGARLVVQGGNTGLVGGQTPDESGEEILLSLARLDRVREVDPVSDTMTVEAGVTLARAQEAAAAAGRLFPLSLASEGSCTVGGNLSTNAGGLQVIAYGNARDLCLGLEVVLADGRIWDGLGKLRKDNTGYDLKNLFIGAEGTLGVVTAAVLKLKPRPAAEVTALAGVPDPDAALALLGRVGAGTAGTVTSFELMPRIGVDYVLRHAPGSRDPFAGPHPWYVLVEVAGKRAEGLADDLEAVLADAFDAGLVADATVAASLDQRNGLWKLREMLSEVQRFEGGSIKHDVAVPVARVPAFLAEATAAVEAMIPGCRPVPFGHLGDGNIHFNVSQPVGADKAAFLDRWEEMNTVVHAIVSAHGGSISAEHGIGRLKRDLLPGVKGEVAMDLMRRVKAALDPAGVFGRGRILPP